MDTAAGSVTERGVPLPERWLKGFWEAQALAQRMRQAGELTGTAVRAFGAADCPATAVGCLGGGLDVAGGDYPAGRSVRGRAAPADRARAADAFRAQAPGLRPAGRARRCCGAECVRAGSWVGEVHADDQPGAVPRLSGEGALLGLLADEDAAADAHLLAGRWAGVRGLMPPGWERAWAWTGSGWWRRWVTWLPAGGLDMTLARSRCRELPFGGALEVMHPRLASARDLIAAGAVVWRPGARGYAAAMSSAR
jgi:hypothetical protein